MSERKSPTIKRIGYTIDPIKYGVEIDGSEKYTNRIDILCEKYENSTGWICSIDDWDEEEHVNFHEVLIKPLIKNLIDLDKRLEDE